MSEPAADNSLVADCMRFGVVRGNAEQSTAAVRYRDISVLRSLRQFAAAEASNPESEN